MALDVTKKKYIDAKAKLDQARKAAEAKADDAALAAAVKEAETEFNAAMLEFVKDAETDEAIALNTDVQEKLAKARKDEKDKLYGRMTDQEKEIQRLQSQLADKEKLLAAQAAAATKKNDDDDEDENADDQARTAAEIESVKKALETKMLEVEKELVAKQMAAEESAKKLREELDRERIEAYRNKVIQENGAAIVPELVKGNTKEEIDNSVTESKQVKLRILKEAEAARAGAVQQSTGQVPTLPQPPGGTPTLLQGKYSADQIKKMSPEEWAKARKELGLK